MRACVHALRKDVCRGWSGLNQINASLCCTSRDKPSMWTGCCRSRPSEYGGSVCFFVIFVVDFTDYCIRRCPFLLFQVFFNCSCLQYTEGDPLLSIPGHKVCTSSFHSSHLSNKSHLSLLQCTESQMVEV